MDNELKLLDAISAQETLSQRELSERVGISLGAVNLLLKKMIHEGLIKVEKIPANRVVYMLTPMGMMEKVNKTIAYIRYHYAAIEKHHLRLKEVIEEVLANYGPCYYLREDGAIDDIVENVIKEMRSPLILPIGDLLSIDTARSKIVLTTKPESDVFGDGVRFINLVERM